MLCLPATPTACQEHQEAAECNEPEDLEPDHLLITLALIYQRLQVAKPLVLAIRLRKRSRIHLKCVRKNVENIAPG